MSDIAPTAAEEIRVGLIGGGFMGGVHSRAARAGRATLVAVAASTPERGKAAAVDLGFARAEHDATALASSEDLTVVHVCSPNAQHVEHALAAIRAGHHVVCEKPLAVTVDDAVRMRDAAATSGVIATVPFVYRYHANVRQARALVAGGALGAILTVDAAYLQDWLLGVDDDNWRADTAAGGASRAFADIGSHLCDLLEFVTGQRITRLSARTRTVFSERGGRRVSNEDIAALVVEFADGALGTLLVSQLAPGRKNGLVFELHGTQTSVRFAQERPEELWIGKRDGSQLVLRDPATDAPASARLSLVPAGHPQGYQDAFNAFVADTYAAIAGEDIDGLPTFEDGLRAAQLTQAVLDSAGRDGGWVETPFATFTAG